MPRRMSMSVGDLGGDRPSIERAFTSDHFTETHPAALDMASGDGESFQLVGDEKKGKRKTKGNEKEKLMRKKGSIWIHDVERDNRYRKVAICISLVSIVITVAMGIVSFVLGIIADSVATFGFACGAVLDSMTSTVVVWRYWGNKSVYSTDRERKACICLGILFILTTVVILSKSTVALVFVEKPRDDQAVWSLSLVNGIACTLLAITKYWLGTKLHSSAVKTDGFNSLIDAVMAFAVLISTTVYTQNDGVWYLDAIVGTCCAIFFLIYGIRLLLDYVPKKNDEEGKTEEKTKELKGTDE